MNPEFNQHGISFPTGHELAKLSTSEIIKEITAFMIDVHNVGFIIPAYPQTDKSARAISIPDSIYYKVEKLLIDIHQHINAINGMHAQKQIWKVTTRIFVRLPFHQPGKPDDPANLKKEHILTKIGGYIETMEATVAPQFDILIKKMEDSVKELFQLLFEIYDTIMKEPLGPTYVAAIHYDLDRWSFRNVLEQMYSCLAIS